MTTFTTKFEIGDKVVVDGARDLAVTVIAYIFYGSRTEVQVSWWHSGDIKTAWVLESRLECVA